MLSARTPYTWREGDLLSLRREELPELDGNKVAWIVGDIEQLLESGQLGA